MSIRMLPHFLSENIHFWRKLGVFILEICRIFRSTFEENPPKNLRRNIHKFSWKFVVFRRKFGNVWWLIWRFSLARQDSNKNVCIFWYVSSSQILSECDSRNKYNCDMDRIWLMRRHTSMAKNQNHISPLRWFKISAYTSFFRRETSQLYGLKFIRNILQTERGKTRNWFNELRWLVFQRKYKVRQEVCNVLNGDTTWFHSLVIDIMMVKLTPRLAVKVNHE